MWHGVGIKPIERFVDSPGIKYRTYKNILNTMTYIIITNYFSHFPLMEEHFTKMLNLDEDQIIRSGYPANMFNKASFSSFDHNIKNYKDVNSETKIALYAPTFRDYEMNNFLEKLYLIWRGFLKH